MSDQEHNIRDDFPIFKNHPELVYLDSTATTQKPESVIKTMTSFVSDDYATINRGIYTISQKATEKCLAARKAVQSFINAKTENEIVFVKGTKTPIFALKPRKSVFITFTLYKKFKIQFFNYLESFLTF